MQYRPMAEPRVSARIERIEQMLEALLRHDGVAMGAIDVQRAFRISKSTFFKLQHAGELRPFLLPRDRRQEIQRRTCAGVPEGAEVVRPRLRPSFVEKVTAVVGSASIPNR